MHRKAEESFDISADLEELAQTAVIVVSAGAKAILDVPKTLEVLETKGVPVVTYGQDEFPAFWSRSSGLKSPLRLDSAEPKSPPSRPCASNWALPAACSSAIRCRRRTKSAARRWKSILAGRSTMRNAMISGKAVTPYLLDSIFHLSGGASLKTNIALVENNARLAAQIAVAMQGTADQMMMPRRKASATAWVTETQSSLRRALSRMKLIGGRLTGGTGRPAASESMSVGIKLQEAAAPTR